MIETLKDVVEHLSKYGSEIYGKCSDRIHFFTVDNDTFTEILYESDPSLKDRMDKMGGYEKFQDDMADIEEKLDNWKDVLEFFESEIKEEDMEMLSTFGRNPDFKKGGEVYERIKERKVRDGSFKKWKSKLESKNE